MRHKLHFLAAFLFSLSFASVCRPQTPRWTEAQANAWYAKQPWLVGSNYTPATAINELEMWQAETFDPQRIDLEFGWAESLGFNTMRVFLHDLLWQQDAAGFQKRIDTFLGIAEKHHIKILFVLFDSCWDPRPQLGKQHAPRPGVHNSGWVQSPGAAALRDPAQLPRLEAYVKGVVGAFAKDQRVLGWDVWNEPNNKNSGSYADGEPPNKIDLVLALLPRVFAWAREAGATQPLTSGVWEGDWSSPDKLGPTEKIQLQLSDVISFHNYAPAEDFEKHVHWLRQYSRWRKKSTLQRSTGDWLPEKRKRTIHGIPGDTPTSGASLRCGSTKYSAPTANPTVRRKSISSALFSSHPLPANARTLARPELCFQKSPNLPGLFGLALSL